jgi:sec-independent protein translocase protein TatA
MLGIGGSEILFILVVILMLFGSKNIPEVARTLGKTFAQIKNATNEIKHEIKKGAQDNGIDVDSINKEIDKAKNAITSSVETPEINNPIQEVEEEFNNLTGPIKRRM